MAALIKGLKFVNQITNKSPALVYTVTRNHWNKDYKPTKIPQTEAEHIAAAKKYYLLPEEYRPYPDDGLGQGDYPHIEDGLGTEAKDPYYPYDYPELKRNFNDTLSVEADMYGEDRYSLPEKPRYENAYYFKAFFGVMAASIAIYYFLDDMKMFRPVLPKQYPHDGKPNYTFEQK